MSEKNKYTVEVKCSNCKYGKFPDTEVAVIERGTSFSHWKINNDCPRCGCKTLESV